MKKTRGTIAIIMTMLLALSLSACNSGGASPAGGASAESVEAEQKTEEISSPATKEENAAATAEEKTADDAETADKEEITEEAAGEKENVEEAAGEATTDEAENEEKATDEEKTGEEATEAGEEKENEDKPAEDEAVTEKTGTDEADAQVEGNTEESSATEKLEAEPLPLAGVYNIYGGIYDDIFVKAEGLGIEMVLTLKEDGTGDIKSGENTMAFSSWSEKDGKIVIGEIEEQLGTITHPYNGVLEISDGEMIMIFTQENADVSAYTELASEELFTEPEFNASRVAGYVTSFEMNTGIHLSYDYYLEAMDFTQTYESYIKDSMLYSVSKSSVMGQSVNKVKYYADGLMYELDPEAMTGKVTLDYNSLGMNIEDIGSRIQYTESLFAILYSYAIIEDYTEETRELESISYNCEVFKATDINAEAAFYYDENNALVYIELGESPIGGVKGGSSFTIHSIDTKVDEAVFDISDYTLEE